jgi:predicted dehydrogenase
MKCAVIGYGYWGRNIVRTIREVGGEVSIIYDKDIERVKEAKKLYDFREVSSYEDVLKSDVDSIFIITPPATHFELAKKALSAGKHIFVEKPFTLSLDEAYELIELAEKKNLIYMVDYVFIYSEPVKYIKTHLKELGDVVYINSRRINLGLFQYTTDVIWDLAVHDLSIIDYLVGLDIERVSVFKKKYKNFPNDALANINLELKSGITIGINVSWLSPVKVREMIIGGSRKSIVYDDTIEDKIKVYDAGVVLEENLSQDEVYKCLVQYRYGDIEIPKLPKRYPLNNAIEHFFECVKENKTPITAKESIINVTKALEIISKV